MVSYTIKVDMPNMSPGSKVQIHGLGVLENGKTVRVSDEQAGLYRQLNGSVVQERNADGTLSKGDWQLGAPLDEANLPEGITVTKDDDEEPNTAVPEAEEEESS